MSQVPEPFAPTLHFPESDGAPLGETGKHAEAIIDLVAQLRHRYHDREDVYVGANQFMYWEPKDPREVACPDLYLVFGRPKLPLRDTWKVWEEDGHAPDLIVEVTSKSTRHTDVGAKPGLYASLGVRELVLFDPLGEYLEPRLIGYRLRDGRMERIPASPSGVYLETVDVWLRIDGERAQAWSSAGAPVPNPWRDFVDVEAARNAAAAERDAAAAERDAAAAERDAAAAERDAAAAERDALAARVAALEAELAALRRA